TSPTGPTGPTGPAKPRITVKVSPGTAKVKAGRKATLKVKVTAAGAKVTVVKVCAKATGKARGKLRPAGCKTLRNIVPGRTSKASLVIRTTRRARGKYPVRISASGPGLKTVGVAGKVKVTR